MTVTTQMLRDAFYEAVLFARFGWPTEAGPSLKRLADAAERGQCYIAHERTANGTLIPVLIYYGPVVDGSEARSVA